MNLGAQIGYFAVVLLSAFSLGGTGLAAYLDFKMREGWGTPNRWRAVQKLGYMILVGTILWLVIPSRAGVPLSLAAGVYLAGLMLGGIGSLGVTITTIKSYVDQEVRKEEDAGVS